MNTAEDYVDAANKIFGMKLKGSLRQDVSFVMLEIIQRQKVFNMFYIYLIGSNQNSIITGLLVSK